MFLIGKRKYCVKTLVKLSNGKKINNIDVDIFKKYIYDNKKAYWGFYDSPTKTKIPINIRTLNILPIEIKKHHIKRINNIKKDIIYTNPILITTIKKEVIIIDGLHRLEKANILGLKTIPSIYITIKELNIAFIGLKNE